MEKTRRYRHVKFAPEVIKEAFKIFVRQKPKMANKSFVIADLSVERLDETWKYDTDEEFFEDYRRNETRSAIYDRICELDIQRRIRVSYWLNTDTSIMIRLRNRSGIEAVFGVFEKHLKVSRLPEPEPEPVKIVSPPTIFIGHGRDKQWRDLKDHLHEKHRFKTIAYEIGARTGHQIRDILQEMLDQSSFAILVMTGEDKTKTGRLRARQNVIHELGLFQGRLGFTRAIALIERGVERFSNIEGVDQVRYKKGNIKETYGDVLAALRQEFGELPSPPP